MRDYALGTTFDVKFTTRRFTTGAPFTLAGTPVISAYPDNSTTEITAGITLSVDFDGRTGLNNIRIVATSGNGYATATNYALVITTGTVDGVSVVGEVVGEFSLEAQSPLRPATAGRTLVVDAAGLADATAVKVGPTGAATAQTAGDIIGDTNDIQTRLPAALVGGRMDSDVGNIAAGGQSDIRDAVGLAAANLDTQLAAIKTVVDAILVDTGTTLDGKIDAIAAYLSLFLDVAVSSRATPAQVNAEVLDVLTVDTFGEPTGVPPATTTLALKIGRLHQALRNGLDVTATAKTFKDDAVNPLWKKPLSDDGTTYTEGEGTTP